MDALELRQTLLNDLVAGLKKSVTERSEASSVAHAHYLTGRIETLRSIVEFLVNFQADAPVPEAPAAPEEKEDKPKRKKGKEAK